MNWASDGLSDAQIAQRMSISRSSFYNYRQQYPEFAGAIEAGRDVVDGRVETTLLDLALGNYMITTYVTDDEGRTRTTVKRPHPISRRSSTGWSAATNGKRPDLPRSTPTAGWKRRRNPPEGNLSPCSLR
ncbi:MAG: hypothetical protein WC721_19400 [Victivallaceae bacterium]